MRECFLFDHGCLKPWKFTTTTGSFNSYTADTRLCSTMLQKQLCRHNQGNNEVQYKVGSYGLGRGRWRWELFKQVLARQKDFSSYFNLLSLLQKKKKKEEEKRNLQACTHKTIISMLQQDLSLQDLKNIFHFNLLILRRELRNCKFCALYK